MGKQSTKQPAKPLTKQGLTPLIIGGIFIVALFAFEIFNFDTTRYALANLLGDVRFVGIGWATILAIAFCGIDLAGLLRFFVNETEGDEPANEVWYLLGAWLLGATLNALMTWWAVSLVLLNHDLGNEVLNRAQLLEYVPIFVAVMVWLTRILFIGSFTVAGQSLFNWGDLGVLEGLARPMPLREPVRQTPLRQHSRRPGRGRPMPATMQAKGHQTEERGE